MLVLVADTRDSAREAGVRAMDILRRLIAGETLSPRRVVLDVELVVRESCGRH